MPEDPLGFFDGKPYPERLAAARKATGEPDAMAIGAGAITGAPAVVLVQDFAFMGGSLGMAAGGRASSPPPAPPSRAKRRWSPSPPRGARACRRGRCR